MVVQKAINNLKERPEEEKTTVAMGAAVFVVAVLLFFWGLWFVSNLKRGGQFDTYVGTAQEEFLPSDLRGAQKDLFDAGRAGIVEVESLRDRAVDVPQANNFQGTEGDVFEVPATPTEF